MAIHFTCIRCGKGLKVRDELAGSEGQCPHCKVAFRVPAVSVAGEKAGKAGAEEDEFDPIAFLNEEPAATGRKTAIPATIPANLTAEDDSGAKNRGKKGSSKPLKAADSGGDGPRPISEWDQAMTAREMRNALKASVREAKEKRENDGLGIQIDFRDAIREYGPSVIGSVLLMTVLVGGVYWMFDHMLGGTLNLPNRGFVSGVVTLNGEPLPAAMVYFAPQEETEFGDTKRGGRARTSIGVTDAQGRYKMMYMEGAEGVAIGKCRVWIECMDPSGKVMLPGDYSQAALQIREVIAGNQTIDFSMKFVKPPGKK